MKNKEKLLLLLFSVILFYLSKDTVFFWDNVLFGSRMGHYFFENGFSSLRLPVDTDPGHPPFLALLMAFIWRNIDYSLFWSHLVLLPFSFGFFIQLHKTLIYLSFNFWLRWLTFFLIIFDPTLSAQLILINPEIFHLFFFFLALNGILYQRNFHLATGLFFLGIVSFRGMFLCAGIATFDILNHLYINKNTVLSWFSKKTILSYSFGALPAISFVLWRVFFIGWLQTHPNSPWADCWRLVNINEFFRNFIILIHRFIDFGRGFVFVIYIVVCILYKNKLKQFRFPKNIIIVFLSSFYLVSLVSLISINPFGHRYFIIPFIILYIFIMKTYFYLLTKRAIYKVTSISIIILILGNFIVYPKSISQGWDASLAHYPYSFLRTQALTYMKDNSIELNSTATFFPNYVPTTYLDLNGSKDNFVPFDNTNEYVFYSNVFNLDDFTLSVLETDYIVIKEFKSLTVNIQLLQKAR